MLQGQERVMTRNIMQMDKRTALPLRIPKNGGGCTKRRPILDVHDVKQQKCRSAAHARAIAPRMHGSSGRSTRASTPLRARAIDSFRVLISVSYGPIGSLLPGGGGWWPAAG